MGTFVKYQRMYRYIGRKYRSHVGDDVYILPYELELTSGCSAAQGDRLHGNYAIALRSSPTPVPVHISFGTMAL